jgi:HrpA-like RNA helicase
MASPAYSVAAPESGGGEGFEWLIPGLRHELLVALIKSMPKPMRKNFVPAPNYADAAARHPQSSRGRCWTRWSVSCAA